MNSSTGIGEVEEILNKANFSANGHRSPNREQNLDEKMQESEAHEQDQTENKKHVYEETVDFLNGERSGEAFRAGPYEINEEMLAENLKKMAGFEKEITKRSKKRFTFPEKLEYFLIRILDSLNNSEVYLLTDQELIIQHRDVVNSVVEYFEKSKENMSFGYQVLDEEREKNSERLRENIKLYIELESDLERIEKAGDILEEKASKTKASDPDYLDVLSGLDSLKLERQRTANEYEKTARNIMNSKTTVEEILRYQVSIAESIQTVEDAMIHLSRVNMQSLISGTASSSLSHGQVNLGMANDVVDSLSNMVSVSYFSMKDSLNKMNERSSDLERKTGNTDYSERSIYQEVRSSREETNEGTHKYVRELFDNNIIEK